MSNRKERAFSLDDNGKESISERIRTLIGGRSVRAAAQDWGLSFSTLNNYLTRGTEPSLNVAIKIATCEGVSVEWLATGGAELETSKLKASVNQKDKELLRSAWTTAFEFMGSAEVEALLRIIINGGARGLIKLAEHEVTLEEAFMLLPHDLKQRAINLVDAHVEAKRGAPQDGGIGEATQPAFQKKQAS